MRLWMYIVMLMMAGMLVNAQLTTPIIDTPTCGCGDQLSTIQVQNSLIEQNIKASVGIYANQTASKFDAQQVNFESKMTAMENRIYEHVDTKIVQETDQLKFEIGSILSGCTFAGIIMALYIALGG